MDCLRLEAGALGQTLCGTAGRGTERDRDPLGDQDLQQRFDERGFPNPGAAGDDHHLGDECGPERCLLAVGKRQLRPLLDPRDRLIDVDGGPGRLPDGKRPELFGDFALASVKPGKEYAATAFEIVGNDSAVVELEAQRRLDQLGWHFEQLFGEGNELLRRQTAMPVVHRLGERVGDPCAHTDQRGPRTTAEMPWRPCEAMTIRSQPFDSAVSIIAR